MISFIPGIPENAPFHPERPLLIASSVVLPLGRFEVAEMLKNEYGCLMLLGKLDNAVTHQMRYLLIHMPDVVPEMHIVLLVLCKNTGLVTVACDTA